MGGTGDGEWNGQPAGRLLQRRVGKASSRRRRVRIFFLCLASGGRRPQERDGVATGQIRFACSRRPAESKQPAAV